MKSLKILAIIGASLTILGSFLPWEQYGDFTSYWDYGIRLVPQSSDYGIIPVVSDNGGMLVVLLTVIIALLTFKPPKFIKNSGLWILVSSALLMAISLVFVARYVVHRFESDGAIGAATLQIGLIAVMLGASLLMWSALMNYRQIKTRPATMRIKSIADEEKK